MRRYVASRVVTAALIPSLLLVPSEGEAQEDALARQLRESQQRLDQIRVERDQLAREMQRLRSQADDLTGELANVVQQTAVSASLLRELEFQTVTITTAVEATTGELLRARDRLHERRVVLRYRLRSIYKRGPLHAVRVLLSADSFSGLLNRYKYLHLIAAHDRHLIEQISTLEQELSDRERELGRRAAQLQRLRAERLEELVRLEQLETEQEQLLLSFRVQERDAERRLGRLADDEARLTRMIAALERRRAEAEAARSTADSYIRPEDVGSLPWPAQGPLLYRFGPERQPNGVVLRRNGIGIAARHGAPVVAVQAGNIAVAGPFEGYGPTVMISHGGGYYSVYLFLDEIQVRVSQDVLAGEVVGTVGGDRTREGTHLEFQLWAPVGSGSPAAVDPLYWLERPRTR